MINDLDASLEALLKRELPAEVAGQLSVSFLPPDDQFPPAKVKLPAVDLFLYDVRENRELRSNEWSVERESSGKARRSHPITRVDCSYLVTAWPHDKSPSHAVDEHRILGEVLLILLRYPELPTELLQGRLANQELPVPTVAMQAGLLQSFGEFWQALGGKPKVALNYTVTIPVQPFDAAPTLLALAASTDLQPRDQ